MTYSFIDFILTAGKNGFLVGYARNFCNGTRTEVILYREDGIVIYADSFGTDLNRAYAYAQVPLTEEGFTFEQLSAFHQGGPLDEFTYEICIDVSDFLVSYLNNFCDQFKPNKTWMTSHSFCSLLNSEDYDHLGKHKELSKEKRVSEDTIPHSMIHDFSPELRAIINQ